MKYIVKCGDRYFGPFTNAGKAAAWAAESFAEISAWIVIPVRKP